MSQPDRPPAQARASSSSRWSSAGRSHTSSPRPRIARRSSRPPATRPTTSSPRRLRHGRRVRPDRRPAERVVLPAMSNGDLSAAADALLDAARRPARRRSASPASRSSANSTAASSRTRTARWPRGRCSRASRSASSRRLDPAGLQFDFDGGTDLHDLNTAIYRGYGANSSSAASAAGEDRAICRTATARHPGQHALCRDQQDQGRPGSGPHASTSTASSLAIPTRRPRTTSSIPGAARYKGGWWPADAGREVRASGSAATARSSPRGPSRRAASRRGHRPDVPDCSAAARSRRPRPAPRRHRVPSGAGLPEGVEPGDEEEPPADARRSAGRHPGRGGRHRPRPVPDRLHRHTPARWLP